MPLSPEKLARALTILSACSFCFVGNVAIYFILESPFFPLGVGFLCGQIAAVSIGGAFTSQHFIGGASTAMLLSITLLSGLAVGISVEAWIPQEFAGILIFAPCVALAGIVSFTLIKRMVGWKLVVLHVNYEPSLARYHGRTVEHRELLKDKQKLRIRDLLFTTAALAAILALLRVFAQNPGFQVILLIVLGAVIAGSISVLYAVPTIWLLLSSRPIDWRLKVWSCLMPLLTLAMVWLMSRRSANTKQALLAVLGHLITTGGFALILRYLGFRIDRNEHRRTPTPQVESSRQLDDKQVSRDSNTEPSV